ncbi:hypothetical protein [Bacillus testis]|uniref:hypothetical protein n=1 Tax=Bacillus testis TaxID=1622072 RepID=UPI00067E934A|nr:hypothetical protein [Bacillus testis]
MEILIKQYMGSPSNYEVYLNNNDEVLTSVKGLSFLEVVLRINYLIKENKVSTSDLIKYKFYNNSSEEVLNNQISVSQFIKRN